jgi:hypothetical protein
VLAFTSTQLCWAFQHHSSMVNYNFIQRSPMTYSISYRIETKEKFPSYLESIIHLFRYISIKYIRFEVFFSSRTNIYGLRCSFHQRHNKPMLDVTCRLWSQHTPSTHHHCFSRTTHYISQGTVNSESIQTPSLFHILLRYSLILKFIKKCFILNLHAIPHNDKAKTRFQTF